MDNLERFYIKEYGKTLISVETGKNISDLILKSIASGKSCVVDFSEVYSITTQVANAIFSPIIQKYNKSIFKDRIKLIFPDNDIMVIISNAIGI